MFAKSNWAIENKVLGGACPSIEDEKKLKKMGVTVVVNLMEEKIRKGGYQPDNFKKGEVVFIHFGVTDMFIFNEDKDLIQLVDTILELVKNGEVVFMHCAGGHGRTGIVAVVVIAKYYNISEMDALSMWQKSHAGRSDLGKHGKPGRTPQTKEQLYQIHRVLTQNYTGNNTIYFYNDSGKYGEFSNLYISPVKYKGRVYSTSEHAFQAAKFDVGTVTSKFDEPSDVLATLEYQEIIRNASTPFKAKEYASQKIKGGYKWRTDMNGDIKKYLDKGVRLRSDWEDVKVNIMYEILIEKFTYTDKKSYKFFNTLLNTENKKLVEHTTRDHVWGDGGDGSGNNYLGETLMKLRKNARICILLTQKKRGVTFFE